jgi:hypothetical protein
LLIEKAKLGDIIIANKKSGINININNDSTAKVNKIALLIRTEPQGDKENAE